MIRRDSLFVLCAFVLLAGCQADTSRKGQIGEFKAGERAQIGSLIYDVFETQYLVTLGEGAETRVPKNRFFVIHLSVVNGGGATSDQSIPTFTLVDDAGESYTELENGTGLPQWLGLARKVRPAESLTGDVLFDVAPKHYKLRIADDGEEHYGFVDLPLTFGEPAPKLDPPPPSGAAR